MDNELKFKVFDYPGVKDMYFLVAEDSAYLVDTQNNEFEVLDVRFPPYCATQFPESCASQFP
ncbi:MAG: hypothetical protein IPK68_09585 [Bdellovibrionales bacterium]|nr:hypothetical protein [Bdellovibrionales bacterium]